MKQILIIEDDENIAEVERDYLEANEFEVDTASDGKTGLQKALAGDYALILLDIMLPLMNGFDVCRAIRREKETPILMVTAKQEEIDAVRGLGLGANDYIVKPFRPNELVARVKAHITRYEHAAGHTKEDSIQSGDLCIYPAAYRVTERGEEINLTRREFELLLFLAQNAGIVFSRETLFERVWGEEAMGDSATVMVHIGRIREKIEPDPSHPIYIETVWGAGYRFKK